MVEENRDADNKKEAKDEKAEAKVAEMKERKNGINHFFTAIQTGHGIEQLIDSYKSDDPLGKDEIIQKLAGFVQKMSEQYTGLKIPVSLDKPETIVEAAKGYLSTIYGKKAFRKMTDYVNTIVDTNTPGVNYGIILPELETLAEKVGAGRFDDAEYSLIKQELEQARTGTLDEKTAYNVVEKSTLEDIDELIKHKTEKAKVLKEQKKDDEARSYEREAEELKDDKKKLAEITAKFWAQNRVSDSGKMFYQNIIHREKLLPYATPEKNEKLKGFAQGIKTTALSNGKAESYDGYKAISEFGLKTTKKMQAYQEASNSKLGHMIGDAIAYTIQAANLESHLAEA